MQIPTRDSNLELSAIKEVKSERQAEGGLSDNPVVSVAASCVQSYFDGDTSSAVSHASSLPSKRLIRLLL